MKGQTKIELRDAASGRLLETHHDENMMTNAIRDYFANMGLMNSFPQSDMDFNRNQLVENLLGGVMLFDDTITESASIVFPPAGLNMIANGGIGYTSNVGGELGSYAEDESGWQVDGSFVQTYNFTTTQGNGTIASCCLTSKAYGGTGDGNSVSKTKHNFGITNSGNRGKAIEYGGRGYGKLLGVDPTTSTLKCIDYYNFNYDSSHAEEHYSQTGKIKISTYKIPLSIVNLNVKKDTPYKVSSVEVTLPQGWVDAYQQNEQLFTYYSDQYMYIYKFKDGWNGWNDQNPFYCLRIDMSGNVTFYSPSNTTGKTSASINVQNSGIRFHGEYMFLCYVSTVQNSFLDTTKVYKVNMSTSASTEINNPCGSNPDTTSRGFGYKYDTLRHDGGVVVDCTGRFDLVNGVFVPNNMEISYENPYMPIINAGSNRLMRFSSREGNGSYSYYYDTSLYALRSTDYIASINNLENPVVKDSSKTMKVTYRITF